MAFLSKAGGAAATALLLFAASASWAATSDLEAGSKLARKYCRRCHAIGATGASAHPAAPPFRQIAAKGHVDDLQEALAEGITVGHPDMPEFALAADQVAELLAYLKSLAPDQPQ